MRDIIILQVNLQFMKLIKKDINVGDIIIRGELAKNLTIILNLSDLNRFISPS